MFGGASLPAERWDTHFPWKPDPCMIRDVTLQVRRVARETCRKTVKIRRDGWGVSLSTEINFKKQAD